MSSANMWSDTNDNDFKVLDANCKSPRITFEDIKDLYSSNVDIEGNYIVSDWYKPTSQDWIGLYYADWDSIQQYVTYEWAPKRNSRYTTSNVDLRHFIMKPKNMETALYQLLYISEYKHIIGMSKTFHVIRVGLPNTDEHTVKQSPEVIASSSNSFVSDSYLGLMEMSDDESCSLDTLDDFDILHDWRDSTEGTSTDCCQHVNDTESESCQTLLPYEKATGSLLTKRPITRKLYSTVVSSDVDTESVPSKDKLASLVRPLHLMEPIQYEPAHSLLNSLNKCEMCCTRCQTYSKKLTPIISSIQQAKGDLKMYLDNPLCTKKKFRNTRCPKRVNPSVTKMHCSILALSSQLDDVSTLVDSFLSSSHCKSIITKRNRLIHTVKPQVKFSSDQNNGQCSSVTEHEGFGSCVLRFLDRISCHIFGISMLRPEPPTQRQPRTNFQTEFAIQEWKQRNERPPSFAPNRFLRDVVTCFDLDDEIASDDSAYNRELSRAKLLEDMVTAGKEHQTKRSLEDTINRQPAVTHLNHGYEPLQRFMQSLGPNIQTPASVGDIKRTSTMKIQSKPAKHSRMLNLTSTT